MAVALVIELKSSMLEDTSGIIFRSSTSTLQSFRESNKNTLCTVNPCKTMTLATFSFHITIFWTPIQEGNSWCQWSTASMLSASLSHWRQGEIFFSWDERDSYLKNVLYIGDWIVFLNRPFLLGGINWTL